jgi:hypothetical protein
MYSVDPYQPPATLPDQEVKPQRPQLGSYSLLLTILAVAFAGYHRNFASATSPGRTMELTYALVALVLLLTGFIGSMVALIKHRRSAGVLIPAGAALLLSGSMLAIAGVSFMDGRDRAIARREEAAKNEKIIQEMLAPPAARSQDAAHNEQGVRELNASPTPTSTGEPRTLSSAEKIARLEVASRKLTGIEGDIARLIKPLLIEKEECSRRRSQYQKELHDLGRLKWSNLQTVQAIQGTRVVVQRLADELQRELQMENTIEDRISGALHAARLAEADIQTFFAGFRRNRGVTLPYVKKLISSNLRGSQALLSIFDLLQQERGEWRADDQSNSVYFNRRAAQEKFEGLATECAQSSSDMNQALQGLRAAQTAQR